MLGATNPLAQFVCVALLLAELLLLARVILSWAVFFGMRLPVTGPLRSAYDLLIQVTEVGLRPLRRIVPPAGMFDISVLVAFIVVLVARLALHC
jgi:YggT family protein